MARLFMLCGCPGVGKSTWAKENVPKNAVYISRDEIRYRIVKPNEPYFSKETEVYSTFVAEIKTALYEGYDVYADATHLNRSSRSKLINAIGRDADIEYIALVFKAELETCLYRNSLRSGRARVPEDQVEKMWHSFTIPTKNEGFSEIYVKECD